MRKLFTFLFLCVAIAATAQDHCETKYINPPLVGGSVYTFQLFVPQPIFSRDRVYIETFKVKPFDHLRHLSDGIIFYQWLVDNRNGSSSIVKGGCENYLDTSPYQGRTIILRVWQIQTVETPRYIITSYPNRVDIPFRMQTNTHGVKDY